MGTEQLAPGPGLLVAPDFPVGFPGGTAASLAIDLPSATSVIGQRLYLQAAILRPSLPGGASFSAAASVLIGH